MAVIVSQKKKNLHVTVIVPYPMVHLSKLMGSTNSNRSSVTPNSHTPDSISLWDLLEITITVSVRTQTWDVMKSQQSPTSCTTPASGFTLSSYPHNQLHTSKVHTLSLLSISSLFLFLFSVPLPACHAKSYPSGFSFSHLFFSHVFNAQTALHAFNV